MTITPDLFAQAGRALFGEDWKRPLSQALGMNERTVFRIAAAARDNAPYPISPGLAGDLAKLLRERARQAQAEAAEAERLASLFEGRNGSA